MHTKIQTRFYYSFSMRITGCFMSVYSKLAPSDCLIIESKGQCLIFAKSEVFNPSPKQ